MKLTSLFLPGLFQLLKRECRTEGMPARRDKEVKHSLAFSLFHGPSSTIRTQLWPKIPFCCNFLSGSSSVLKAHVEFSWAYAHSCIYIICCVKGILEQSHLYSVNKVILMSWFYVALPVREPEEGLCARAKPNRSLNKRIDVPHYCSWRG